jgi:hypothetical protein
MLTNPSAPLAATKTMTFTGAAGLGAIGNVPLFTVTGTVLIEKITAVCLTTLVGATATLALGVTGATALLIAATTATTITGNLIWSSATPSTGGVAVPAAMEDTVINANIVGTVATAAITAGVIRFDVVWRPLSANGGIS